MEGNGQEGKKRTGASFVSVRKEPQKVKPFFSVFASSIEALENAICEISKIYGEIDCETDLLSFDITNYYEAEFGKDLKRRLFSMKKLISPSELIEIKLKAYELEERFSNSGRRVVNIDPGYVALSRVVLLTGKDYTHRIYLDKGVYADLTLIYKKDAGYVSLPWTYPDYSSSLFLDFFTNVRNILKIQLKGEKL